VLAAIALVLRAPPLRGPTTERRLVSLVTIVALGAAAAAHAAGPGAATTGDLALRAGATVTAVAVGGLVAALRSRPRLDRALGVLAVVSGVVAVGLAVVGVQR
jgi:hypothetical protein